MNAALAKIERVWLVRIVLVLGSFAIAAQADAQGYQPARPTISPYLYLTKPQQGPLPNYQTYVQPLKNQAQTNQMQQTQLTQLQQSQEQLQLTQTNGAAGVAPTGVGSAFNSLSHYYPGASAGGGGAGRGKSRR
jgi:hypothetical protein